jgi:hypothetical protein
VVGESALDPANNRKAEFLLSTIDALLYNSAVDTLRITVDFYNDRGGAAVQSLVVIEGRLRARLWIGGAVSSQMWNEWFIAKAHNNNYYSSLKAGDSAREWREATASTSPRGRCSDERAVCCQGWKPSLRTPKDLANGIAHPLPQYLEIEHFVSRLAHYIEWILHP